MRGLALLAGFLVLPTVLADDFANRALDSLANRTTVVFYFKKFFGVNEKRDAASSFGFRLDRSPGGDIKLLRTPIVDVTFNDRGFDALAFRGSVLHQNQPASGAPAPEINWWIVGGVAIGTAIVINNDKNDDAPAKKGAGN